MIFPQQNRLFAKRPIMERIFTVNEMNAKDGPANSAMHSGGKAQ